MHLYRTKNFPVFAEAKYASLTGLSIVFGLRFAFDAIKWQPGIRN